VAEPGDTVADLVDLHSLSLVREGPDGPFEVLRGLDLQLAPGQRLALLGDNGSGKSSLLRYLATPGTVPGRRAGLVFQDPEEQLVAATVAEELLLGRPGLDVEAVLAGFGLAGRGDADPLLLSAGQKQRLQLAVVLAGEPDLLLLDEPTSLQDPQQAAWLRSRLQDWPGAMIWATQQASEARLCDRVLVLAAGRSLLAGPVDEVLDRPEVEALLQPRYRAAAGTGTHGRDGAPVARLAQVCCRFGDGGGLAGVDLELRGGDRVGITGPNGSGKSTLLAVLAGLRRPESGAVTLMGCDLYARGRQDLDHGQAALAPQFPEYLFCCSDVAAEVGLDPALQAVGAGALLGLLDLPAELARRHPHDLSGGQKRRLALGLALAGGRPLILLDEPTAALDAPGRAMVAQLVQQAPPQAALVIASHDTGFLAACGCRILHLGERGLAPAAGMEAS
jgi:energy-coupling factor transporter ATP-binding protein EcfA2